MPRTTREQSEENRSRILDAAYPLFLSQGFHATSMREIAQQAQLSTGAMYNHFQTKEEIWKAVLILHHPYHQILPVIAQALQQPDIPQAAQTAAREMIAVLKNHPDLFNLMFIEFVEFKNHHFKELVTTIAPALQQVEPAFERWQGHLRHAPPLTFFRAFMGYVFSFYITAHFMEILPPSATDEAALSQFIELFLFGALADDDPARNPIQNESAPTL